MDAKPKAGGAAAETLAADDKQKAQSARFIKAAREAAVDETGKIFEKAMDTMGKAHPSK